MALTKRGTGWELIQSWYIVLCAGGFGMGGGPAFLYLAGRARKLSWLIFAILYTAPTVYFFYHVLNLPEGVQSENHPILAWFVGWVISVIHALIVRKEFLLIIDARSDLAVVATEKLKTKIAANYGLEEHRVDKMLVEFNENDYTVKLCRLLFGALPFAPDFQYYFNLEGAVRRHNPNAGADVIERARKLAASDEVSSALKITSAMDSIDKGLGIYTGVKNVYDHIKKQQKRTFEADQQQAIDASVKALGLAYMIHRLFPDYGVTDKIKAFMELKAGREILLFYASAEVALPFTDNLLEGGGELVKKIMTANHDEVEKRFKGFAGGTPLNDAAALLSTLSGQLAAMLEQVKVYADPLTERVKEFIPSVMNAADSISGGAATAIDVMPAWRFLGARLAAEACAYRAERG